MTTSTPGIIDTTKVPTHYSDVSCWRIYLAGRHGLYSPFPNIYVGSSYDLPVEPIEHARCFLGCTAIPGIDCTCGWYACDRVGDLRALVVPAQNFLDGKPGVGKFGNAKMSRLLRTLRQITCVALVGIDLIDALPAPLPLQTLANIRKINSQHREHWIPTEPDSTWRGRVVEITGPIVVTDPEVVAPLHENYGVPVHHSPVPILTAMTQLMRAGRTHGHQPADLTPVAAELFPSTTN